jgi:formylglycine-generating enzyme required for sulfatase activity
VPTAYSFNICSCFLLSSTFVAFFHGIASVPPFFIIGFTKVFWRGYLCGAVVEYCNKRSQKEGLTPAYTINKNQSDPNNGSSYDDVKWTVTWNKNANGYRLPTEAEWEYACRAGTTTAYNTGANISDNTGWYSANSGSRTHPVGQKSANAWGLYDMHGNVWEWCWDWRGDLDYWEDYSRVQTNPTGAVTGAHRMGRGGSWGNIGRLLRSAQRCDGYPSSRSGLVGFRLVRS